MIFTFWILGCEDTRMACASFLYGTNLADIQKFKKAYVVLKSCVYREASERLKKEDDY